MPDFHAEGGGSLCGAFTGSCVTSTPVAPAPLTPGRATQLTKTLPGTWLWMASEKEGGKQQDVSHLLEAGRTYVFNPDGTMKVANTKGTWSLDGANLSATLIFKTARVEECTPSKLTLFVYDNSTWMYFQRK